MISGTVLLTDFIRESRRCAREDRRFNQEDNFGLEPLSNSQVRMRNRR